MANIEKVVTKDESATIEEVVRDCTEVWNVILKRRNQVSNDNEFLRTIHKQFPRLAESFPIIIRIMMSENFYDAKIVAKYLEWVQIKAAEAAAQSAAPPANQFLVNQAEYYTRFYFARNPASKSKDTRAQIRMGALKMLEEEDREFRARVDQAQKEIEKHREEKLKWARQELLKLAKECVSDD